MLDKATPLVEMEHIKLAFGGIHAVDDVSIDLYPGEVVGIVGHNGAGKSCLIKVLSGAYQRDSGAIRIDGKDATINNPRDAKAYGIETIYQTLAVADNVDAAANLFLGRELKTGWGTLDDVAMEAETRKIMGRLNPNFERFKTPVVALSGGQRQSVAIATRHLFQRAHPDHGRAHCGTWPAGNPAGRRAHQTAQGRGHRHLPDQPRHPRRVRSFRPRRRDEETDALSARPRPPMSPRTRFWA